MRVLEMVFGADVCSPYKAVLTAQWYFRKFFLTRKLGSVPSLDIALTAVLLANKVEDVFDKIRHVLVAAFMVLNGATYHGRPEEIRITEEHRKRVIQYERDLLISVGFNFNLSHAHTVALKLAQDLRITDLLPTTWLRLDSLYIDSDFILVYPPHVLAMNALLEAASPSRTDELREILRNWCKCRQLIFFEIALK